MPPIKRQPSRPQYAPMILTLLVMSVVVGGFFHFSKKQAESRVTLEDTPLIVPPPPQPTESISEPVKEAPLTIEKKSVEEINPEFEITITYPAFQKGDTSFEHINDAIRTFINTTIKQFKDDFNEEKTEGDLGNPDVPWSLTVNYSVPYQSKDITSIVLSISRYTGGVHPNGTIKTFVVEMDTMEALDLDDVLTSARSLGVLSDLVMRDLEQRIGSDKEWIANGASPAKEHYASWYLSSNGLTVLFPPYHVAPYSGGVQEVLVSKKELKDIVKPQYIIAE